jgi:hypothetical protein
VVGAAFSSTLLAEAVEGSLRLESDNNDVTGGREGWWKKLGVQQDE